jgi:hypothetical protein
MSEVEKEAEVVVEDKATEAVVEKPVAKENIVDFYNPKKEEKIEVKQEAVVDELVYEFKKSEAVDYDDETINKVKDFSKSNKLSVDNAQKVVDLATEAVLKERKKTEDIVLNRVKAWDELTRRDKEIGGAALQENIGVVKTFLKRFGNDEVANILRQSGLGSHPEFLRMMYRAGKAISEDNFVTDPGIVRNSNPHVKNEVGETMFRFPSLEKK